MNFKELAKKLENVKIAPGHRSCSGCGFPMIMRTILAMSDDPVVVANATGCMEVTTTIYPFTSWKVPYIHNAFENAAATISGVETAYRALKEKGRIKQNVNFVAFGGDGGTYDIGLQSLSGALERGHRFIYVLYDNEAYMNCLSLDTMIMTKKGLRRITEIKKGGLVYAFNLKTCLPVLKKVSGVFNNGKKMVYQLRTINHLIKTTSNHPFLVFKRNINTKKENFIWKTLSEIGIGDKIVVLKNLKINIDERIIKNTKKSKIFCVPETVGFCEKRKIISSLEGNKNFKLEKVIKIKKIKVEPTLDLRVEGEHNFIADGIVVHNTGVQRSSATPYGASTTTCPAGKIKQGKEEFRKDIMKVVAAHKIPYVAQASISNLPDLSVKAQKAFNTNGPAFIVCLQPCTLGWRYPAEKTIQIAKLAVETRFWPLYEIENGRYILNYNSSKQIPVEEYMKTQGRFKHLFKPENKYIIEKIQNNIDQEWKKLLKLCQS